MTSTSTSSQTDFSADSPTILLVNPAAGSGKAIRAVPRLREFARNRWQLQIVVTSSAGDLSTKAKEAAARGCKQILVLGGDGTFQILLNALFGFPELTLGIVPAGGGNDLASAIGLPSDSVAALRLLENGSSRHLDAVRVTFADGTSKYYCGGGGVGLDAEASRFASTRFQSFPGRSRYLFSALRALWRFHPISVHAVFDAATEFNQDLLLLSVLNTPSYGAGLRLAPLAQPDDGVLDLVCLQDLSFWEILKVLPALACKGEINTPRIRRHRLTRLRIETQIPRNFHGDGEILGLTPLDVEIVRNAVRVLYPNPAFHAK